MDPTQISLFQLAKRRLAWADKRQELLAQNIANANTPGYRPRDLQPFAATLAHVASAAPLRTQPNHLSGTAADAPQTVMVRASTHALNGNQVGLEDQMAKVADTETTQSLVTTIYKTYLGLFNLALGRASTS